jgi:hypothetical protein
VSVGSRAPIVAAVITLVIAPVSNGDQKRRGYTIKRANVHTLRCIPGEPIRPTPVARRLGLVGETCRSPIMRRVRVKSRR